MSLSRCITGIILILAGTTVLSQSLEPVDDCPCNQRLVKAQAEGVVFCSSHTELIPVDPHAGRFTPSLDDVLFAEECLERQIEDIDSSRSFDGQAHMPVIRRNLGRYHRQYFGLSTSSGDRILWISFLWSDDVYVFPGWQCSYTYVLHADTWFWSVYVNLDTGTCYGLETSGP